MKKTENYQAINGTSFHGDIVTATVNELTLLFGEPSYECNDGEDKCNFEWDMEDEEGRPFTIYDWKQYRPIGRNELVDWHIGGHSVSVTSAAAEIIANLRKTL